MREPSGDRLPPPHGWGVEVIGCTVPFLSTQANDVSSFYHGKHIPSIRYWKTSNPPYPVGPVRTNAVHHERFASRYRHPPKIEWDREQGPGAELDEVSARSVASTPTSVRDHAIRPASNIEQPDLGVFERATAGNGEDSLLAAGQELREAVQSLAVLRVGCSYPLGRTTTCLHLKQRRAVRKENGVIFAPRCVTNGAIDRTR